jgi:hypothetical protein
MAQAILAILLASAMAATLVGCFGTSPSQAEKFRPDRKAFGSATLATRAVASAGPMPGISSSRLLVSLDRADKTAGKIRNAIGGLKDTLRGKRDS